MGRKDRRKDGVQEELPINRTEMLKRPLGTEAALNGLHTTGPCQRLSLGTQGSLKGSTCPAHSPLLGRSLAVRRALFHTVADFLAKRNY